MGATKPGTAAGRGALQRYVPTAGRADPAPCHGHQPTPRGFPVNHLVRRQAHADAGLPASGVEYATVRPGSLTDDPGMGRVGLGARLPNADVPRDAGAAVRPSLLHAPAAEPQPASS